jgi:hypothetical protein
MNNIKISVFVVLATVFCAGCIPQGNVTLTVDAAGPAIGTINQRLNDYSVKLDTNSPFFMETLTDPQSAASLIRVEFGLSHYDCNTEEFGADYVASVSEKIDAVQQVGAQVMLLVTYNASCLAREPKFPTLSSLLSFQPERRPAENPDDYQHLVEKALSIFTTDRMDAGKKPVTIIEGWNEPDFFLLFFHGFRDEFIEKVFIPTGKAITQIENDTGLELTFFTSATSSLFASLFGGSGNIAYDYIASMVDASYLYNFELEGIAWHYYASSPFTGLGESEFSFGPLDPIIDAVVKRINPQASAQLYLNQIDTLKINYPDKLLAITEWSIVPGVFDIRTHNHEGAALTASTITAMQEGGLDYAQLFTLINGTSPFAKGFGLINNEGKADQRLHAVRFWGSMGEDQLQIAEGANEPSHDVWATASRHDNGDISLLVSNYRGQPRFENYSISVLLDNANHNLESATASWLDNTNGPWDLPRTENINFFYKDDNSIQIDFDMPAQSVVKIHIPAGTASQ